jgi:hypothetical protein
MIRPLRRRHRWMIPSLLLLLVAATILAITHPAPSPIVERLPSTVLAVPDGSEKTR